MTLLWIIAKHLKIRDKDTAARIGALLIILFILGFIVVIANDSSQISSITGLLGAIAGYYLKESKELIEEKISEKKTDTEA